MFLKYLVTSFKELPEFCRLNSIYGKILSLAFLSLITSCKKETDLLSELKSLPAREVVEIEPLDSFKRTFKIAFVQPLDHENNFSKTFTQLVYLSHVDASRPMVIDTQGYTIWTHEKHELSNLLNTNQLVVEHRYFGDSKPDSIDWRFLNIKQAAADHHRIVQAFKKIYKGKWISTGFSKGGQTALFHRRFFPNDVDATVVYSSPIPLDDEDERLNEFLFSLGDSTCQAHIKSFQRNCLKQREQLIPRFREWAQKNKKTYSIGLAAAFEYAVLEYPFSFWQAGAADCTAIPVEDNSTNLLFQHLKTVVPLSLFSDSGIVRYRSSYYQFFTELGYYGFRTGHLKDLLLTLSNPTNKSFVPKNTNVNYNPEPMQDIIAWLQNQGNNIIYIYGANDAWTGAAVHPSSQTNALKMVIAGQAHGVRMKDFSEREKQLLLTTLKKWLQK